MTDKKFPAPAAFTEKEYVAIPMAEVKSGQVARVGYDDSTKTLAVQFRFGKQAIYHYPDVLPSTYEAFLEAESKGTFFDKHIKPLGFEKYPAPEAKKETA